MASGSTGEVVHCPNCKEDVPKTLYCLNCGYPLYKEEQKAEGKPEPAPNDKTDTPVPNLEDTVVIVDDEEPMKEAQFESSKAGESSKSQATAEPSISKSKIEPQLVETPAELSMKTTAVTPVETISFTPIVAEPEMKEAVEPVAEVVPPVATEPEPEGVPTPVVESPPPKPVVETPPVEKASETLSVSTDAYNNEALMMVEKKKDTYVPDALSRDLMENLAKNLTMRIRLVNLYREGRMKEETFVKLFEEYTKEGTIYSTRRNELIRKLDVEIEELDSSYTTSTQALELLDIRKYIGDASEEEYAVKAPAYRWDIDNFDSKIFEKKNKSAYLKNIEEVIPQGEMKELRESASLQYNTVDALQITNEDVLAKIKESLYEAIKYLG